MVFVKVPFFFSDERNFFGPLRTTTLWGFLPFQLHCTLVPDDTVSALGTKRLSLRVTTFVAPNAGIADSAAAARHAATSAAASFFIREVLPAGGASLEDGRLGVVAPDLLERLDDLPLGGVHPGGVDEVRHEVRVGRRCTLLQDAERLLNLPGVAARADALDAIDLLALQRGVDAQGRELLLALVAVAVDADHDPLARVDA